MQYKLIFTNVTSTRKHGTEIHKFESLFSIEASEKKHANGVALSKLFLVGGLCVTHLPILS